MLAILRVPDAQAGGSGFNVAVVVNQSSSNSVALGNYYCEQRGVPPQNLLRIQWTGGNIAWTRSDFLTNLAMPVSNLLSSRGLTHQIDYVVLSMDIPYRVTETNGNNATTSALYYGFVADVAAPGPGLPASCSLPDASSNSFAASEVSFRSVEPGNQAGTWMVTMITASNLNTAEQIVDQGVASDSTFPTQTVWLAKTTDPARNVRFSTFDNAVFNTQVSGDFSVQRTNSDSQYGLTNLLGYETGWYSLFISPGTFIPGAMADSLTSFGGQLFEPGADSTVMSLLGAGAAASYGTITEPCNYLQKFPSPQDYYYQLRGFNIGECYYLSVTNPYQGLLAGEPLAAPFARAGSGSWNNLPANATLAGVTNLSFQFNAADFRHPLQQVDLFLDGQYLLTATNVSLAPGNVLYVTLPGASNLSYTVQNGDTLAGVATQLSGVLDQAFNTFLTQVVAYPHGDRIELQSQNSGVPGSQTPVTVSNSIGSATALTTFIQPSLTNFLDSGARGLKGYSISGTPHTNDTLQLTATLTNGSQFTVGATYTTATNLFDFVQQFTDAINTNAALSGTNGLDAEDVLEEKTTQASFNLLARAAGLAAAQVQVSVSVSPDLANSAPGTATLTDNSSDLIPRDHLYITCGAAALPVRMPLDTRALPDGYHQLSAVAYEGSSVRTQTRITQSVVIQNSALSAVLTALVGGTNTALEATLQFSVAANTNDISQIELFSTGGSQGVALNQTNAVFSIAATNLGIGLHPFYAIVTDNGGRQYRTPTQWFRVIGQEPPFSISASGWPTTLSWPSTAGRTYDVLSATDLAIPFQPYGSVTPSNSSAVWTDANPFGPMRFYRIGVFP
jgi:uncharacterized protein (TIGR03790 family)